MAFFTAGIVETTEEEIVTIQIGFGDPAGNDKIVPAAVAAVAALELKGGKLLKIDGRAL